MSILSLGFAIVGTLVMLLAPGYFTVVAFARLTKKKLDWTFPEAIFTIVVTSVLIVSWFALLLAEVGVFSITWILVGIVVYVAVIWAGFTAVCGKFELATNNVGAARERRGGSRTAPTRGRLSDTVENRIRRCADLIPLLRSRDRFDIKTGPESTAAERTSSECTAAATFLPCPKIGFELVGVASIAILATSLFVQPFDYVVGGLDIGTYANAGFSIAQSGSIVVHDPTATGLTEAEGRLFFGANKPWVFGSRVVGFYLVDLVSGAVQPQGFHLFPVWIALLYGFGGVKTGLLATPLFGALGALSLYFLGRRLFNPYVGLLASFFLTISVAQIWFSRVPLSEVVVQFFLLAGLYLFALTVDYRSRFFAALAGLSLGMAHLAKIELVLLPVSILGFFFLAWAARRFRGEYWYVIAGYLAMVVHAILHAVFVANVYAVEVAVNTWIPTINSLFPASTGLVTKPVGGVGSITIDPGRGLALIASFLMLAVLAWLVTRLAASKEFASSQSLKELTSLVVLAFVTALAAFAWFVRPIYQPPDPTAPAMEIAVQLNNRNSLLRLGWYISPLGVLLGLAGLVKGIVDEANSKLLLFLAVSVPTSVLLLFNSFITPVHFWAERRFVYIVIPAFLLLAAYALYSLRRSIGFGWRADVVPASIAIALVLTLIRPAIPYLRHVEYSGASAQVADLATALPPGSTVLFEHSLESNMFTVPLRYLYNVDVRMLGKSSLSDAVLHGLLRRWQGEGKRVFWIAATKAPEVLPPDFRLSYVATRQFSLPEAEATTDRLPFKINWFRASLDIFEVVPIGSGTATGLP